MAAGVTEVIVEKEQEQTKKEKIKKKDDKKELEGKKDRHSSKDKWDGQTEKLKSESFVK